MKNIRGAKHENDLANFIQHLASIVQKKICLFSHFCSQILWQCQSVLCHRFFYDEHEVAYID